MATMMVRRAKVGVHDDSRGLFLNRGVFIKAPPDFFQAYPSEFEAPPQGYEKLKVHIRTIESWDPKLGLKSPAPKMEVPPPEPTVVPQPVSVVAAASEPVAASANVQQDQKPAAPSTPPKPAAKKSGRTVRRASIR